MNYDQCVFIAFYMAGSHVAVGSFHNAKTFSFPPVWTDFTIASDVSAAVALADGLHIEDERRALMFDSAVKLCLQMRFIQLGKQTETLKFI